MEIGVEHGGTFAITVELLRRFQPVRSAIAVDLGPMPRLISRYRRTRPEVEFVAVNSGSQRFRDLVRERGPFDLVLVDGDHSEEGCMRDFEAVRGHARMIAFHDIEEPHYPGVRAVWQSVPGDEFELHEFTAQYDELLPAVGRRFGIGLAIRR
jgi:DNA-binding transcriptional LysR family regulator